MGGVQMAGGQVVMGNQMLMPGAGQLVTQGHPQLMGAQMGQSMVMMPVGQIPGQAGLPQVQYVQPPHHLSQSLKLCLDEI